MPKGTKQQFIVLLILSLYVLFTGAKDVWNKVQIRMYGVTTTGVVIESWTDSATDICRSTIQYTDERGQVHTFISNIEYKKGETIEVKYNRNDPSKVHTTDFKGMWLWPAFLLWMGMFTLLASIGGLLATNAKNQNMNIYNNSD